MLQMIQNDLFALLDQLFSISLGFAFLLLAGFLLMAVEYCRKRYKSGQIETLPSQRRRDAVGLLSTEPDHLHGIDGTTYIVEFWLENDTFQPKPGPEISRLLRTLADEISHGRPFKITPLFDRNGIIVGDAGVPKTRPC